jgi:hypothetical protein
VEGEAHRQRWCVATTVVDGGLGEAFGLVLHDEDCINSVQQHQKEEEGGGSPKRGVTALVWLRHVMTLAIGRGSGDSERNSEVGRCSVTYTRGRGSREGVCPW